MHKMTIDREALDKRVKCGVCAKDQKIIMNSLKRIKTQYNLFYFENHFNYNKNLIN